MDSDTHSIRDYRENACSLEEMEERWFCEWKILRFIIFQYYWRLLNGNLTINVDYEALLILVQICFSSVTINIKLTNVIGKYKQIYFPTPTSGVTPVSTTTPDRYQQQHPMKINKVFLIILVRSLAKRLNKLELILIIVIHGLNGTISTINNNDVVNLIDIRTQSLVLLLWFTSRYHTAT